MTSDLGSISRDPEIGEWLRNQRVCVTGGRGALGRRLIRRLMEDGVSRIVVLDAQPTPLGHNAMESGSIEHLRGSILDLADLEHALSGCTIVFHLAALVHVGRSQTEPLRYFEVNGLGTAHVLETCRRLGIRRVVYTSTGHVYGIPCQLPVAENHPTVPISAYAASKLAGEMVMQGYAASYGISCDIVRLSNLYGASFGTETAIGCALRQVACGEPIALRNLTAIRDFVHADDAIEALVRLAAVGDSLAGCRIVNVSTSQGVSVREMAQTLASIAAEQGLGMPEVIQTGINQTEIVLSLVLDNSRLRELTHWTPHINLEQGLRLALQELEQNRETEH